MYCMVARSESQLRKGALELITLGLLAQSPSYGGQLLERLRIDTGLEVTQGTVYPLLNRLRTAGLLHTSWEESPAGPPRKVYELSPAGRTRLIHLTTEWERLSAAVTHALKGPQQ